MCFKKKKKVVRSLTEIFVELLRDPQLPYSAYWTVETSSESSLSYKGYDSLNFLAYNNKTEPIFGISIQTPMKIVIFEGSCIEEIQMILNEPAFNEIRKNIKMYVHLVTISEGKPLF